MYKHYPRLMPSFIFVAPNNKNSASNYYTRDCSRLTTSFRWLIKAYSLSYSFHHYVHPGYVPLDEYVKEKKNIWLLYAIDTLATPPKTYYTYHKEILAADYTYILRKVHVPVLLLVGQNDTVFPPRIAKDMHQQLPRSTLKVMNGDHSIAIKKTTKFNNAIVSFLNKLS